MVCENCGYNNRDGVPFCRHCGISLKEKKRLAVRPRTSSIKSERYKENDEFSFNTRNTVIAPVISEDYGDERVPGEGKNFKTATVTVGILVFASVIAFCIFAFDLIKLPGSGGSITVNSSVAPAETPAPDPTPSLTPVPTVAPGVHN